MNYLIVIFMNIRFLARFPFYIQLYPFTSCYIRPSYILLHSEEVSGGSIRRKYPEEISGGSIRRNYLEELSGGSIRRKYPEEVSGGTIWRNYLEEVSVINRQEKEKIGYFLQIFIFLDLLKEYLFS